MKNGQKFKELKLNHGTSERVIENAVVRIFQQDGETKYEATGTVVEKDPEHRDFRSVKTVGFLPEDVAG